MYSYHSISIIAVLTNLHIIGQIEPLFIFFVMLKVYGEFDEGIDRCLGLEKQTQEKKLKDVSNNSFSRGCRSITVLFKYNLEHPRPFLHDLPQETKDHNETH